MLVLGARMVRLWSWFTASACRQIPSGPANWLTSGAKNWCLERGFKVTGSF